MAKSREEILALAKRTYDEVEGVRIQSLTELEKSSLESMWAIRYGNTKEVDLAMRRELLVRCIVDDEGQRLFKDREVDLIGGLHGGVTTSVYESCRILCGMDRKNAVEKIEKKFEETAG